jgi:hypothetical protein
MRKYVCIYSAGYDVGLLLTNPRETLRETYLKTLL